LRKKKIKSIEKRERGRKGNTIEKKCHKCHLSKAENMKNDIILKKEIAKISRRAWKEVLKITRRALREILVCEAMAAFNRKKCWPEFYKKFLDVMRKAEKFPSKKFYKLTFRLMRIVCPDSARAATRILNPVPTRAKPLKIPRKTHASGMAPAVCCKKRCRKAIKTPLAVG